MPIRVLLTLLLLATPTGAAPVPDGAPSPAPGAATASPAPRWAGLPRDRSGWGWPTGTEARVLQGFAPPSVPWGSGHRGVDLALAPGAPVYAAAAGTVVFAGTVVDRPVVSIDHAGGIRTTHEPVRPVVAAGDRVGRGDLIGTLAPGHCEEGCLHLGARIRRTYIDPLLLLDAPVVRLLPW